MLSIGGAARFPEGKGDTATYSVGLSQCVLLLEALGPGSISWPGIWHLPRNAPLIKED